MSPRIGRPRPRPGTMAHRADKHALYERAVQDPVSEVEFVARTFRRVRDRPALTLREDFCGTGVFALQWARSRRDRRAWGIDLDRRTLDWGREHRLAHAEAHVVDRVELIQGDVLQGLGPTVDVACAFNFSYWTFKTRERLRQYFRIVRRRLADDGMFFLDVMGGVEVPTPDETRRSLGDFVYRWEQASFNPLTNELVCHIHFEFPDGSALSRAFTYDWRLWSIPELRELLLEAGFRRVHVYWEKTDAAGRGTGGFYQPERVHNDDLWWTYISAER